MEPAVISTASTAPASDSTAAAMDSPAADRRLPMVDAVRFICILWVLWIHITEAPELSPTLAFVRFRMPVFVILSIFFLLASQEKHPHRRFPQYAAERLKNLYLPFLAWSAIYYLLHGCCDTLLRSAAWPGISRTVLLHGQAVHLWFVPFIVLAGILVFPLARWLLHHAGRPVLLAAGALGAGMAIALVAGPGFTDTLIDYEYPAHLKDFLWRAITLSPCLPMGIAAFFIFKALTRRSPAPSPWLGVAGLALVTAAVIIRHFTGIHPLPESVAGLGIVLFALAPARGRAVRALARWGRYSFGMYLVHLLFVDACHILREFAFHLPPSAWFDVASLLLCAPATFALTLLLGKSHLTRWLVPSSAAVPQPAAPHPSPPDATLARSQRA